MKKNISLALLIFLLCTMAVPVFASIYADIPSVDITVMDLAQLLTSDEELELSEALHLLSQTYQAQVIIYTIPSAYGEDLDDFIEELYDANELGYGDDRSGILLLVSMEPREAAILSNGAAQDAIGDSEIDKILDAITDDLSDGNYADAFNTFADRCEYYLDGYLNGFPFDWSKNLLIALVIGLVVGLITVFVLKAQLKSVRPQNRADAYVKPGSMHLTHRSDLFLYRRVTRTRKENSNSSRSGSSRSGSRSVGSRSF